MKRKENRNEEKIRIDKNRKESRNVQKDRIDKNRKTEQIRISECQWIEY